MKKININNFIEKAKKVHGDKYDYSKVEYVNNKTKVCIICPEHGEFWQTPSSHLNGCGCPNCGKNASCKKRKLNTEHFVKKAKQVNNDKYNYSKVKYITTQTKVCIICPEHGEFWQTPAKHLSGQGCPKCGLSKISNCRKSNSIKFVEKAKLIHNNKYDYSKVEYFDCKQKVCIICPEHGEFWQKPSYHLSGHGCPKCGINKSSIIHRKTTEEFIKESFNIHRNKYDYSKSNYINANTKVCIICPKHGEFWQTPYRHIIGQGCPICKCSTIENDIRNLLIDNSITFIQQKKFIWLGQQSLDFYLPDYNIAIECQGKQHFEPSHFFNDEEGLIETKEKDKKKMELCRHNNVKLLYYANYQYKFPYKVITSKNKLLKLLKQCLTV